ncbi:hypothetical protein EFE32_10395 [Lactococcus lactis subsp. lactis]|uniref:hypothetical protein n=1 Tax=Lactococcus lactis TaxID=1358 RepID=UPI00223B8169|nr:hypothetical protein [Lactococcus lactis]MCT0017222.1 hypothetical protein [Lactococcus lactis subsp. lactis]
MKTSFNQTNQYSEQTARKFVPTNIPVKCVTAHIETQFEYVDKQRTENIKGYKLWFVQEGNNPFTVKFEQLQGIEIRSNVYFKAVNLKVVK